MGGTNYEAVVVYDEENAEYFGRVIGKRDGFTFIGRTPADVAREFRISFDDYVNFCIEHGKAPDESITGAMQARVVADIEQAIDAAAQPGGMTLNQWLGEEEVSKPTTVTSTALSAD